MNEWRKDYDIQRADFPTRLEVADKLKATQVSVDTSNARMHSVESKLANIEGRIWAVGVFFTVFATGISLFLYFIPHMK
jgi:hypothetical protein